MDMRNRILLLALAFALAGCAARSGSPTLVPPQPTTTPWSLLARAPGSLTWQRSGGFAGICQALSVDGQGGYRLVDSRAGQVVDQGQLDPESWGQIQSWLKTYQSFSYDSPMPPGAADMFIDHLQFVGIGQQPASAERQTQTAAEIGRIASGLAVPEAPTQAPADAQQGVKGQALIGPMCPVMSDDDSCPDKPYQGQIQLLDANGDVITEFTTDADGTFQVSLPVGSYVLQGVSQGAFPRAPSQEVTVRPGEYAQVTLSFDTGIR